MDEDSGFVLMAEPQAGWGTACYDCLDDTADEYHGLGAVRYGVCSLHLFEQLALRLSVRDDVAVVLTDGTEEILLLVKHEAWRSNDEMRQTWAEIIATSKEKLVDSVDFHTSDAVADNFREFWNGQDISSLVGLLHFLDRQKFAEIPDLSIAILDTPPTHIIHAMIEHQKHLLLE